jgi:hypothetical protein
MAVKRKTKTKKTAPRQVSSTKASATRWEEFLSFCNQHAETWWWFRGVSDRKFSLVPKIGRAAVGKSWNGQVDEKHKDSFADLEMRVFQAFKRRAVLSLPIRPQTDFEWLAVAQHHGVPTRLLDWTPNPLMAAWFAMSEPHPEDGQVAKIVAVKATSRWREHEEDVDPFSKIRKAPIFVVSPHWHARVRAQRGCFSIHPAAQQRRVPPEAPIGA